MSFYSHPLMSPRNCVNPFDSNSFYSNPGPAQSPQQDPFGWNSFQGFLGNHFSQPSVGYFFAPLFEPILKPTFPGASFSTFGSHHLTTPSLGYLNNYSPHQFFAPYEFNLQFPW